MVSHVPHPHAMHAIAKGRHSFPFLAGLVVLIGIAAIEWQLALAFATVGYACWALVLGVVRAFSRSRHAEEHGDGDGSDGFELPSDPRNN